MIRPLTCISVLLACGSGLYLYQTKHHAQVVDRQIERTVQQITATRMQTRELAAAWTLLGNPDRLQTLANQYLDIKPVQPSQFVALSDLDSRLPPPRALPTPSAAPEDSGAGAPPVASLPQVATPDGAGQSLAATPPAAAPLAAPSGPGSRQVAAGGMPGTSAPPSRAASQAPPPATVAQYGRAPDAMTAAAPDISAAKAPVAVASRPVDRKPPETPRPAREVAETRPVPPRAAASPPVVAELDQPARSVPQRLAPAPLTGSLLGMAHTAVAPPVPLPVSAERSWSNGN